MDRHPAFARLRKDIGGERVGNAEHAFGDRVGGGRRHDHRVIDAVVEAADRHGARRLVVQDAHRLRKIQLQPVHAQHFIGRLRHEDIAMLELVDERETLRKKMAGPGENPCPARRMQPGHRLSCSPGHARSTQNSDPGSFPGGEHSPLPRPHRAGRPDRDRRRQAASSAKRGIDDAAGSQAVDSVIGRRTRLSA